MPKQKETQAEFNQRMMDKGVFRCDDSVLFCLICDQPVKGNQSSTITQHLDTKKHKNGVDRKNTRFLLSDLTYIYDKTSNFDYKYFSFFANILNFWPIIKYFS